MVRFSVVLTLFMICLLLLAGPLAAQEPLTGREIMVRVDERADGDDRTSKMRMTLTNKRGRTRVREMSSLAKDYGKDSKSVIYFLKPADVRGTAFLSWNYDDSSRDDDKWLYLPALKKERRISGSSNNDYFMGSDFTYDDMGDRSVDEDEHRLLRVEMLDDRRCWVVESVSLDEDETCRKRVLWVAQELDLPLRIDYFDKDGLYRRYQAFDIQTVAGYSVVYRKLMENILTHHQTLLELAEIKFDQGIADAVFRVSALQRGRLR